MSTIVWNTLKAWDGHVSPAQFNRLVDAMQSISLNPGLNYNISRTPAGTTILPGGKGGAAVSCPLTVSLSGVDGDPDSLTVKVSPGTVNQFVATNMFDTSTVSDTGTFYVKATVETDGQDVTSWEINVDSSEPDAQSATASSLPTSFDILIAIINDGKVYRVLSCGSITLTPVLAFITDKDSPADPGELTYIPYYLWQVTTA